MMMVTSRIDGADFPGAGEGVAREMNDAITVNDDTDNIDSRHYATPLSPGIIYNAPRRSPFGICRLAITFAKPVDVLRPKENIQCTREATCGLYDRFGFNLGAYDKHFWANIVGTFYH